MAYLSPPTQSPGNLLTSSAWNTYLKGNIDSGLMRMLADSTLGGSAASVDMTSIPATFAHLMLEISARGDTAAATTSLVARFNNDTATNYTFEQLKAAAAAVSGVSGTAQTFMSLTGNMAAASATANVFTPVTVFIPNYASTAPVRA